MRAYLLIAAAALALSIPLAGPGRAASTTFTCGDARPAADELLASPIYADSTVEARIVFVTFAGNPKRALPGWAESLRTDLEQYVATLSRGAQRFRISIVARPDSGALAWPADFPANHYAAIGSRGFGELNTEILTRIATAIPGAWDGVEQVFMIHYQCTFNCTDTTSDLGCENTCPYGGISTLGGATAPGFEGEGTTQRMYYPFVSEPVSEQVVKWVADHEYGHRLGFMHTPGSELPWSNPDYVNVGRYDVMRASASFVYQDGSMPYHAQQLAIPSARARWVPVDTITTDTLGLRVSDIRSPGAKLFRVTAPGSFQYFTFANLQGTNPFDARFGAAGLLFTHVLSNGPLWYQESAWDIESAAGKFTNGLPDPVSGADPLEREPNFVGTPDDLFDGVTRTAFNAGTNPNTNLYAGTGESSPQSVRTSIAFENIRREANGDMRVDVYLTPKQRLLAPNGGEVLTGPTTIRWLPRPATALVTSVDLELSTDGGRSWQPIVSGLPPAGGYTWTPAVTSDHCVIRITSHDAAGGVGRDVSDADFVVDTAPPAPVANLGAEAHPNGFELSWRAPGDDGDAGAAARYVVRYSHAPLDASNFATSGEEIEAPAPGVAGSDERLCFDELKAPGPCWIALVSVDDAGNTSALSNVVAVTIPAVGDSLDCSGGGPPPTSGGVEFGGGFPNPASDRALVRFGIPPELAGAPLELAAFDLTGRRVAVLAGGAAEPGRRTAIWDLKTSERRRVPAGLYFLRLRVGSRSETRTLLVR